MSDLPGDIVDITLWVRRQMPERMERKAKPTVVDRENDFILHPTQKTKDADIEEDPAIAAAAAKRKHLDDLEAELCNAHNRRVELVRANYPCLHAVDSLTDFCFISVEHELGTREIGHYCKGCRGRESASGTRERDGRLFK